MTDDADRRAEEALATLRRAATVPSTPTWRLLLRRATARWVGAMAGPAPLDPAEVVPGAARGGPPRRGWASAAGVVAVVVVVVGVIGAVALGGGGGPAPVVLPPTRPGTISGAAPATSVAPVAPAGLPPTSSTGGGAGADAADIAPRWVHVAGAVTRPGLVRVPAGGRLADAIDAAGGAVAEADLDRVNLAAPMQDGQRVYVPRRGEATVPTVEAPGGAGAGTGTGLGPGGAAGDGGPAAVPPAPVRLNTATAIELDALPGVGPTTAAAIIAWREQHGGFRSVDELTEVKGIGPARLEQLRPHVAL